MLDAEILRLRWPYCFAASGKSAEDILKARHQLDMVNVGGGASRACAKQSSVEKSAINVSVARDRGRISAMDTSQAYVWLVGV